MERRHVALNLSGSAGHVGQMVQLVAQPRTLWEKFLRLLNGDYHAPKQDKQGKMHLVIFSFCFFAHLLYLGERSAHQNDLFSFQFVRFRHPTDSFHVGSNNQW